MSSKPRAKEVVSRDKSLSWQAWGGWVQSNFRVGWVQWERWPSGRRRGIGNAVDGKLSRGFKSRPLRHKLLGKKGNINRIESFSQELCRIVRLNLFPTIATTVLGDAILSKSRCMILI